MDGVRLFESFAKSISDESQLIHLFENQIKLASKNVVQNMLENLLTKRANFQIFSNYFLLFDIKFEFKNLFKPTLQSMSKILILQQQRQNIFAINVTQSYNLRYANCVYNTVLENKFDRSFACFCFLHVSKVEHKFALECIKNIRNANLSEHALLFHINKMLTL